MMMLNAFVVPAFVLAVLVAHVIEWSPFSFNTVEENEVRHKRREDELDRAHAEVVDPVVAMLREKGIDAEGLIRHGHIAKTLNALAGEHDVDALVVGRQGAGHLVAQLFGSVSGSLIQLADRPVTVVP